MRTSRKPPSKNPKPTTLTNMQENFCQHYLAGGEKNGTKAARLAGSKNPHLFAVEALKTTAVLERLDVLRKKRDDRAMSKMREAEDALKKEGITQEMVLRETAVILKNVENHARDRLRAAELCGIWLGMEVRRTADLTKEFEGRTKEELEYFATNGYFPDAVDANSSSVN